MDFVDSKSADLFPSYSLQRDEEAIRSRRRRRMFRHVTVLITSFFLLGWVIKHIPHTKQEYLSFFHSHHHHGHGLHIPSDLTLLDCPDLVPDNALGETSVHLELPITSANIFLLSRGSYSAGVVYIAQSEDSGDVIDVDINVFYDEEAGKHLDHARVCTVSRQDGGDGIGIFTPKHRKHHSHAMARFEVRVTLPREASGSPLNLEKFEVDMPEFAQHVGDLSLVKFHEFSVDTASASIVVDRLVSDRVRIDTSNGPITGHFNTTSYLELITDNGLIDISVDATNVDSGFPSVIKMKTSNSPITASLSLHSVNQTGGSFLTDTQTTTGGLNLDFPIAPVDSSLFLNGRNTFGEVSVQLHETYEGVFSVGTSLGHPGVVYDVQTEKGRRRTVDAVDLERGQMEGVIFRTEAGKSKGGVALETTQGDAILRL